MSILMKDGGKAIRGIRKRLILTLAVIGALCFSAGEGLRLRRFPRMTFLAALIQPLNTPLRGKALLSTMGRLTYRTHQYRKAKAGLPISIQLRSSRLRVLSHAQSVRFFSPMSSALTRVNQPFACAIGRLPPPFHKPLLLDSQPMISPR